MKYVGAANARIPSGTRLITKGEIIKIKNIEDINQGTLRLFL